MVNRRLARLAIASSILCLIAGHADAARQTPKGASKPQRGAIARVALSPRECMARAMYFESNRTQEDGMLAVGTVVANRLASGRFGDSVCEVVGSRLQFAPGVLSRPMLETKVAETARRVADLVLAGERHPVAADAKFFHTANVPFRHDDKRYILVSGGNAFYAWNRKGDEATERANLKSLADAFFASERARAVGRQVVALASLGLFRVADARPVAAEIVAPAPDPLARTLAYREEDSRTAAATAAIAAISAVKIVPRVVEPTAPVLAASGPVFADAAPKASPAAVLLDRANSAVKGAWNAIVGGPESY